MGCPGWIGPIAFGRMEPHLLLGILVLVWVAYLVVERVVLDRDREAVPLHVAVTGTRGKTTVTRRLAAVLKEDGRKVMAKTTGSEPAYLLPDGTVQEIHRLGFPSIIEQKGLLRRAARAGADVVLAEVMSLHRENHRVEVQEILRPSLVLVTNFRVDHVEAQGNSREEVASVLALDVPAGATALVPETEWTQAFQTRVSGGGGDVVKVSSGESMPPESWGEFASNLDLVWAAARHLGVADEVIERGLKKTQDDVGALRCWSFSPSGGEGDGSRDQKASSPEWVLVSAFAANDPESTLRIYRRTVADRGVVPRGCVGLLSLRNDRGDRSLQWVEALREGALSGFGRLFISGGHAHAVRHALRHTTQARDIQILRPGPPKDIMAQLMGETPSNENNLPPSGGRVLFGFGNMEGLGRTMVDHWQKVGKPHGI